MQARMVYSNGVWKPDRSTRKCSYSVMEILKESKSKDF